MSQATKPGGKLFFGYLVVLTMILVCFAPLSFALSCTGIFYTPIANELNVGAGTLSYYMSVLWASSMIFLPLLGKAFTKIGAKKCVCAAIIACSLVFLWLSFTASLWQFYAGAFVMGAVVDVLLFLAPSTLINRWFAKRAGFLIGITMAFTGVGGVIWSSVGGILIETVGWSTTYLVFSAVSILVLPFALFAVANYPEDKGLLPFGAEEQSGADAATALSHQGMDAAEAFRTPTFILIVIVCFFLNFGMYVYFMIPSYCATIPAGIAMPLLGATASSVAMAGQTISKIVLGYVGDKQPHLAVITGVALGLLGVSLFAFGGGSVFIIYAASFAFGFFYGVTNVMMPILTKQAFGNKDYPAIYARISMAASLGGCITGFIWGTLIDLTGGYLVLFVGVGFFMAVTIASCVALMRLSKKQAAQ